MSKKRERTWLDMLFSIVTYIATLWLLLLAAALFVLSMMFQSPQASIWSMVILALSIIFVGALWRGK